ncbi:MAG: hypothetical protein KGS72_12295 [Cyanobacteria bacterium REEB67]|nr:hypothetical protein [Cyanobacteria bacterium REEB67]
MQKPFQTAAIITATSLTCLASAFIHSASAAGASAPRPAVRVLGTKVFLVPPEGFSASENFCGFFKKDQDASIVITEIPGPYEQVITGFNKNDLNGKGMNLTATSVIKSSGAGGDKSKTLIEFTQNAFGKKFKKVALIFGDRVSTMLVTGGMPESGGDELFNTLKASVKTARYDARASLANLTEGLPFTLADGKKLKKALRVQNTLLFTTSGKARAGEDNGPLFVVGHSVGDISDDNRSAYARERLEHTPSLKNVTVKKESRISQAGLEGEEFLAEAVDSKDGVPTFVYHAMLFDKSGYYIFQGLCGLSQRTEYEGEFQRLVKNFQLR